MGSVETALLMELVVVPVVRKLMHRRGVTGVTKENLENLKVRDVKKMLISLKENPGLLSEINEDIADGIDNIAGPFVDAFKSILISCTGGVVLEDGT